MADDTSALVTAADAVSQLLYGLVGWAMIAMGVVGLLAALLRPDRLTPAATVAALSLLFVACGYFLRPAGRRRWDRRRSISRFGRDRTVEERIVRGESHVCVDCDDRMDEGLVRRYREEVLVAGVPVYTRSEGRNHYCPACAAGESGDRAAPTPQAATERPSTATERS
ncbi:hypothetical protein [Haloarcula litorea]|uniref:hypothetical protein n=1 Tax=Haloarcula litorea TaxID=3032579 RepID=UPI0023E81B9A|nr:hypothetical protein [Halomicroarcula sp. GDY20]